MELEEHLLQKQLHNKIVESAEGSIRQSLEDYASTNGGNSESLKIDLTVTKDTVKDLFSSSLKVFYQLPNSLTLNENSQGLGFSNLIYLFLEKQGFLEEQESSLANSCVNILVLEEPESHMHPQMQAIFIRHLINNDSPFQLVITTHSETFIKACPLEFIRVLNSAGTETKIHDLSVHANDKLQNPTKRRKVELLFAFNFSNIVFADAAILYEGDTERLYIESLIHSVNEYKFLRNKYIAYVQVGGAYAHVYREILQDILAIPTVYITDIDYDRATSPQDIKQSPQLVTTNAAIKSFLGTGLITDIFSKATINSCGFPLEDSKDSRSAVFFQTECDSYARTFEEAIGFKLFGQEAKTQKEWDTEKEEKSLEFPVPNTDTPYDFHKIVRSSSFKKTDFIMSLVLSENIKSSVPTYISEALQWLMNHTN